MREELGLSKELSSSVQSTDVKSSEENASLSSRGDVRSNINLTVGDAKSTSILSEVFAIVHPMSSTLSRKFAETSMHIHKPM